MRFRISGGWLQFDLQHFQDFLLVLVWLGEVIELDAVGTDALAADAFESLDHVLEGPLPLLAMLGRELVVKLSAAWGGLAKHKLLLEAILDRRNATSPKLIPPEDRLAIGGG